MSTSDTEYVSISKERHDKILDALHRVPLMFEEAIEGFEILQAEIDRLAALVPSTSAATARRKAQSQERAALVKRMRDSGATWREAAAALDPPITERHAQRLLKG